MNFLWSSIELEMALHSQLSSFSDIILSQISCTNLEEWTLECFSAYVTSLIFHQSLGIFWFPRKLSRLEVVRIEPYFKPQINFCSVLTQLE